MDRNWRETWEQISRTAILSARCVAGMVRYKFPGPQRSEAEEWSPSSLLPFSRSWEERQKNGAAQSYSLWSAKYPGRCQERLNLQDQV